MRREDWTQMVFFLGWAFGAVLCFELPGAGKLVGILLMVGCMAGGISTAQRDAKKKMESRTEETKSPTAEESEQEASEKAEQEARKKAEQEASEKAAQEEEALFAAMDREEKS